MKKQCKTCSHWVRDPNKFLKDPNARLGSMCLLKTRFGKGLFFCGEVYSCDDHTVKVVDGDMYDDYFWAVKMCHTREQPAWKPKLATQKANRDPETAKR